MGRECIHFVVEDLGLTSCGGGNEVLVKDIENVVTDVGQLLLDLVSVFLDSLDVVLVALVLLLLLNGGDDSPGGTAGSDHVLIGNRKEVALLNSELNVELGNSLHGVHHFYQAKVRALQQGKHQASIITVHQKITTFNQCNGVHTIIALGLLSELGHVNRVFSRFVGHFVISCM